MTERDATRRAARWARRLAAGDEGVFAEIYDLLGSRLHAVARSLSRSAVDAEDAVQETFLALVRSRARWAGVRDLEAYVFTTLRRAALRRAELASRDEARSFEEAGATDRVDPRTEVAGSDDRLNRLARARGALPREQQEVLALKIDGELTFDEIGLVLGISANTAASRYRYALEKLRAAVGVHVVHRTPETKERDHES